MCFEVTFRNRILLPALIGLSMVAILAPAASARVPLIDARGVLSMAPILEKPTSAVVSISVITRVPGADNPLLRDPFFHRYFGLPETDLGRQAMSAGSGVIIDARKGHVVTNHHVIRNAERILVTVKDGRQLRAELIGSDAATDIALLKIEARDLSAIELADSDQLKVGDLVLAIGNPFGLGQTVTSGIVSALGRSGLSAEHDQDFIQTDAPINPGNSGGALVNSNGELVGINTAIIAPGGGNIGIGFAVPVNMVKAIVRQLEQFQAVRRGRIGVSVQSITPDIAAALSLSAKHGALVGEVERGSAAERAGIKAGDAILEIDGQTVRNASELRTRIGLRESGSTITVTYFREGQQTTVSLSIDPPKQTEAGEIVRQLTGARLTNVPLPSRNRVEGVYVADVEAGSPAVRLGLRAGDVIVAVNQKPVHSVAELEAAARAAASILALSIQRGDAQLVVVAER
jgi:Do/DeqQ family serine protease